MVLSRTETPHHCWQGDQGRRRRRRRRAQKERQQENSEIVYSDAKDNAIKERISFGEGARIRSSQSSFLPDNTKANEASTTEMVFSLACIATMGLQPTALMPSRSVMAHRTNSICAQHYAEPASYPRFLAYPGKCIAGLPDDSYVGSAYDAEQIIAADPASYPAYLLQQYPDGAESAWLCDANYAEAVFEAGSEWVLCVYQGQPSSGYSPAGGGGAPADVELSFEEFSMFMRTRGGKAARRLPESELRRRFDRVRQRPRARRQIKKAIEWTEVLDLL